MKNRCKIMLSLLLVLVMGMQILSGCATKVQAKDMMEGITAKDVSNKIEIAEEGNRAVTNFSVRLFQRSFEEEKNTLISPISVLYALAMTTNGAEENTLKEMESVIGMSTEELNKHLGAYIRQIVGTEDSQLHMANSIWFKDIEDFAVKEDFLQINADYYDAEMYKAAFDKQTLTDINSWVKKNTNGMIEKILEDKIPDNAIMYLVNALAFEAQWQEIYKENQIKPGIFTKADGSTQEVDMMNSTESLYLEDEDAVGFIKGYQDGKYAFAAILPKEEKSLKEYVSELTEDKLWNLLNRSIDVEVETAMPKFESGYSVEMSETLQKMGMKAPFDYREANFSGLGSLSNGDTIVIDRILHKTFISVEEKGTKAGSATAVEMVGKASLMYPEDMKRVCLDRPFLYMIIDTETNSPIFIGTVMNIEN